MGIRQKALEKLKKYEGRVLTGKEILEITGYSKKTKIESSWLRKKGILELLVKFGDYSKSNKYMINKIDMGVENDTTKMED